MIDGYGHWTENWDIPENEWCDFDWIAWQIRRQGYEPETTMENLTALVLLHYDGELERTGCGSYACVEDTRPYPQCLMINPEDVATYVADSGGWKEFDYWS